MIRPGKSGTLIEFKDTLFVASPEGTSTRRLLDERFASVGLKPKLAAISAQRDAIRPLVLGWRWCGPGSRVDGSRHRTAGRR